MSDLPTTVFVYGTLMPGERNAAVAGPAEAFTAQPATLRGYRLLHLSPEAYPAVIPGTPDECVHGFALTYTPTAWHAALPHFDELEGLDEVPPLYTRQAVSLQIAGSQPLFAWVYLYARQERLGQPGVNPVPSGDWRNVAGRSKPGSDQR